MSDVLFMVMGDKKKKINSLFQLDKEYINKVDYTSTGALLPSEANPNTCPDNGIFPGGLAASRHCVNGYKWDT